MTTASSTLAASAARATVASHRASAPSSRRAPRLATARPASRRVSSSSANLALRARAISDTDVAQDSEALPETRASDDEIPACVGTATKEEFMRWMTTQQALPEQKLEINAKHPIIRQLATLRKSNAELASVVAKQVFSNALISAGLLDDPRTMLANLNKLLEACSKS